MNQLAAVCSMLAILVFPVVTSAIAEAQASRPTAYTFLQKHDFALRIRHIDNRLTVNVRRVGGAWTQVYQKTFNGQVDDRVELKKHMNVPGGYELQIIGWNEPKPGNAPNPWRFDFNLVLGRGRPEVVLQEFRFSGGEDGIEIGRDVITEHYTIFVLP
jgi:hypothetical protein